MFIFNIGDIIGLAMIVLLALFAIYMYLPIWWKQKNCKHDGGVTETMSCEAICKKCGLNLGFIGSEANKERRKL